MKVVCAHCGLPFTVPRVAPGRAPYCCSGCALAARLAAAPADSAPATRVVATAVGLAFGAVNQALAWLLAIALAREGSGSALAAALPVASLALGAAVWCGLVVAQWRLGARRPVDLVFFALSAAGLAWAAACGGPGWALAGNAFLAGWALRGLVRARAAR